MVPTTSQITNPELEDLADSIPYAPPLPFPENVIANNENIFLFEDLPSRPDQDKGKEPVRPWEVVAEDIIEALELPSAPPIKKSIKWANRRSIISIHITAATSRPRRGIKLSIN